MTATPILKAAAVVANHACRRHQLSLPKTLSGENWPGLWNRGILAGDGHDPQAADGSLRDCIMSRGRLEAEVIVLAIS